MLPAQAGGFDIPTQGATDALNPIGHHGFAVARAAQNDAALELAGGDRLSHGPDEQWIIDGLLGMRPEIFHAVPGSLEKGAELFFILKASVIRSNGNFHNVTAGKKAAEDSPHSKTLSRCSRPS